MRRYHHGDLRQALLDATLKIVRKDGPAAVTLRDVAARAGVSEAAPYHHFPSKSHLLVEAAAQGYRALGERLATAAAITASAHDRLVARCCAYVRFALDEPGYFRLLFGAHVVELAAHPAATAVKEHGKAAAELLRQGIADFLRETGSSVNARDLERIVWAQIHGLAWLVLEQELRPQPSVEDAVALARTGLELVLAGVTAQPRAKVPRASSRATRRTVA